MKRSKKLYALIFVIIVSMLAANTVVFAETEESGPSESTPVVVPTGGSDDQSGGDPGDGQGEGQGNDPGDDPGDDPTEKVTTKSSVGVFNTEEVTEECEFCGEELCVCDDAVKEIKAKIAERDGLIAQYEAAVIAFNKANASFESAKKEFEDLNQDLVESDEYSDFNDAQAA